MFECQPRELIISCNIKKNIKKKHKSSLSLFHGWNNLKIDMSTYNITNFKSI